MSAKIKSPISYERNRHARLPRAELKKRNARLLATLQRFVDEGDEHEQKETDDFLMKALADGENQIESRRRKQVPA